MSDKLKKFIQQSKSRFDLADPAPDLFEKILEKMDQQNSFRTKKPLKFSSRQWLSIAASAVLLISCAIYFLSDGGKISSVATTINTVPSETNMTKPIHPETTETGVSENFPAINTPEIPETGNRNFKKDIAATKHNPRLSFPDLSDQITKKVSDPVTVITNSEIGGSGSFPSTPSREIANVSEKSNELHSIPTQSQKQEEVAIQSDSKSKEIITAVQPVISKNPENSEVNVDSTITSKEMYVADAINETTPETEPSIQNTLRKGFLKFLSKKAKKWTGNALSIREIDKGDQLVLAISYKDDKIEVSKNFKLGSPNE